MKRCSTCNRTYTDPNLSFCIDDGTPLTQVETDDDTTVVRQHNTERDTEENEWNAVAYRPPSPYVPPGTQLKPRRRVWPWVVGLAGAFIVGMMALSVVALILVPRLQRQRERVGVGPGVGSRPENSNTHTPATPSNANSNSTENINTPPPSDHDQVLAQLKDLENDWTVANLNADKKKLDRILADDYVGQSDEDGGLQSKADYIDTIERNTDVEKWEFSDLNLNLAGERATLSGIITYFVQDRSVSFDFKDRFVWRDGRWQATGAELKRRGKVGTDL